MVKKRGVVWDKEARNSLKKAYRWIKKDSPQSTDKVITYFLTAAKRLSDKPEVHPPDKYRQDRDARYRAFEKYSYRISYFISEDTIRVLRFRHVKQGPLEY